MKQTNKQTNEIKLYYRQTFYSQFFLLTTYFPFSWAGTRS